MRQLVNLANCDGVGVITVENPPVNALSSAVLSQLESCLLAGENDPAIRALVLIGGGRTFIAGADIKEFLEVRAGAGSVADLHAASGAHGGLAEARRGGDARHRARRRTRSGHGGTLPRGHSRRAGRPPESHLGIIPGAEGTQRLPRLVGVAARRRCALGCPIKAPAAFGWA